eukprot:CAMPEP_0185732306 /NCGR_PEP_ID=MMETSP1171-20130828/15707_1 /TAXON_ID=374046 /ORGANISM="Helicotheca tamensis, Strain CCMP826" /LENGTH=482 /DNA_ID=CAMNT_0028401753 /DNA_START=96 /DNA_END=1544 /DNA_ORIENTATION=-
MTKWSSDESTSSKYEATNESLSQHRVPNWFHNAKLGIFIHWGLYSVPGWAPTGLDFGEDTEDNSKGDEKGMTEEERWKHWFMNNAYAEWYFNTLRIDGSPTQAYHKENYGEDFTYEDFAPLFNEALKSWDPDEMASILNEVHAGYVVLTSKHHDGFLMWPSKTPNPNKPDYHATRDIVGELGSAVRKKGMRMAYYYSGGVDWTFNPQLVLNHHDILDACQQKESYTGYADAHWRELIDRYDTNVLWNDICYPADADVNTLFADFYNKKEDGAINNRFIQRKAGEYEESRSNHFDFETPEYKTFEDIRSYKWESCRGIGHSFGYNRLEGPEEHITVDELIRSFVDIVSKNGNLLLNIGPMANGTIPKLQLKRLRGLGRWLDKNGEAIFDTRPWSRASGETNVGIDVRFTQSQEALNVLLMDTPSKGDKLTVLDLKVASDSRLTLLGGEDYLDWNQEENGISITIPQSIENAPVHSISITPIPA